MMFSTMRILALFAHLVQIHTVGGKGVMMEG
jgi:hypothetical protein